MSETKERVEQWPEMTLSRLKASEAYRGVPGRPLPYRQSLSEQYESERYVPASQLDAIREALEITTETLERCRRDESLTYEEKKAAEEHARRVLTQLGDSGA